MRTTKLQAWCESIIEAGWLAALIVTPLFFNVYSSRVFEPDKISLLRTIALVMLLAYLVKLADGGRAWLPPGGEEGASLPQEAEEAGASWPQRLLQVPFALPVILLVVAYLISTALSVAPRVSWWGSYQRLQGTYTFLSYIIVATLTAAHLRRPEQLRRLQHTVILTSLPIAIYGVIQHYDIDPLPWGGDVVTRVSANAGNPIFLAAYLIMAFFLTLERIYSSFAYLLTAQVDEQGGTVHDMASALVGGSYLFVLIVQLLAIFWSQSRGPWLGLAAGLYVFVLLLVTGLRPRNYRLWTGVWVGLGVLGAVALVLVNTTSLGEPLRNVPYVGRMTRLLESEGGTGRVRTLIWEGVSQMVAPHEALVYPSGDPDAVNPLRPLVGYGPETMWVAFNRFYPPELAQIEARNASPDRSHNETWDSLAITGFLGFLAYVLLFFTLFYWALRWLGLIRSRQDLTLFAGFWLGGGLLLALLFYLYDGSWRFFGVALPSGFMLGLIVYVTLAVFLHGDARRDAEEGAQDSPQDIRRRLLIIAVLATIVAHFVEIHFGIAIAATRTYFWVLSALLLVLGMGWLEPASFAAEGPAPSREASSRSGPARKGRKRGSRPQPVPAPEASLPLLPSTVMPDLLVFLTLAYLYTTNFFAKSSALDILFSSVTSRAVNNRPVSSPGILFLLIFTWLIAATVGIAVLALSQRRRLPIRWWLRSYALHGAVVWGGWFIYGLIQASRLTPGAATGTLQEQLAHIAGHFTLYTWVVIVWALAAGAVFAWQKLRQPRLAWMGRGLVSLGAGAVVALLIFLVVSSVNVALVRADIFYKQGQQFDSNGDWVGSVELYRQALRVRPTEDHYMLFLGRALLEQAKQAPLEGATRLPQELTLDDVLALKPETVAQLGKEDLLRAAEVVLLQAQKQNPLNTDHTANLARLYRTWAELAQDPEERQALLEKSLAYYDQALQLSPHAAHIWNEKGATLALLGRLDEAEEVYKKSLALDDKFENTYLLLAELYEKEGKTEEMKAILEQGVQKVKRNGQLRSYLGVAQARSGDLEGALETTLALVEQNPNDVTSLRNLAILYRDKGEPEEAIRWAERAIQAAGNNPSVVAPLRQLIGELYLQMDQPDQALAQYEQLRQLSPEDPAVLTTLVNLYLRLNQVDRAVEVLETLARLQPNDYRYPWQLAQILAQTGQPDAAREQAQQALALAPADQKAAIQQFLDGLP